MREGPHNPAESRGLSGRTLGAFAFLCASAVGRVFTHCVSPFSSLLMPRESKQDLKAAAEAILKTHLDRQRGEPTLSRGPYIPDILIFDA